MVSTVRTMAAEPAATAPPPFRLEPPVPIDRPAEREAIPLYEGVAPGSENSRQQETWEHFLGQRVVRNVVKPVLLPWLPSAEQRNGKAVVVAPGGGYEFLSIDSEGHWVAKRLAERGYTAFVLKYRTHATEADPRAFTASLAAKFKTFGNGTLPDNPHGVDDLAVAVQFIQRDAARWQLDRQRVGVIGFSAGARSAVRLIEQRSADVKLSHVALLYPPMDQTVVGGTRPPLFLAIAVNDPLFTQGGLKLLDRWLGESQAVEFHLYSGGGHGFGMRPQQTTSDFWIDHYLAWLDRR